MAFIGIVKLLVYETVGIFAYLKSYQLVLVTEVVVVVVAGAVGKIRKQFLERTISSPGLGLLRAVKQYLDPQNIFGSGNLMIPDARL